jgi:hypothetical protein
MTMNARSMSVLIELKNDPCRVDIWLLASGVAPLHSEVELSAFEKLPQNTWPQVAFLVIYDKIKHKIFISSCLQFWFGKRSFGVTQMTSIYQDFRLRLLL